MHDGHHVSQVSTSSQSNDNFPINAKSESRLKFGVEQTMSPESIDQRKISSSQCEGPKYVKWGIHSPQPSYVSICFFSAIALAVGHHFYYKSLNGTPAGSANRQQWAITFGASFSFLVTHLLRAATFIAHSQYIWLVIRRRGYTLENLDNLFSLTSDLRSIFSREFVKHGKIAVLLALITR